MDVLFGRDELAARAAAVLAGSGACHLVGPPGVGTTALARAVAGAIDAEQVVWVDAAGLEPPALLWAALLDPFELEPTPAEPAATTLRAALTGRPVLVVIDGAGPELAAVADSVPAGASGPWLITTSTLLPRGFDAGVVRVRPLPTVAADGRSPAEALFRHHYAHTGGTGDVDAHPSEIGAILSETGGLPVAIRIAAARAALLGFDPAHHRAGPIGPVDRAVRRSIDRLDEAALALLTGLGSADRIVPLDLAAELSGLDGAELGAAVEVLARHSLVEPVDGGVEILTPVRVAVRRLAELRGTAAIADRRHRAWAARRCAGAVGTAGVAELVALAPELRLAISRSLEQPGAVAEAIAVGAALAEALDTVLRHRQALAVLETLLTAVGASDVPTDDVIELRLLVALGRIHIHGGAAGERELERAAASVAAAERPDRALAGIATLRAATAFERGDLDSALDLALAAADAAANAGEDGRRLAALVQVADVHLVAGRLADADDAAAIVGGAGAIDEWLAGLGRAARGHVAVERGATELAGAVGRQLLEQAAATGQRDLVIEAAMVLHAADPTAYRPLVEEAVAHQGDPCCLFHLQVGRVRSAHELLDGRPVEAMRSAAEVLALADRLPRRWEAIAGRLVLGDAAAGAGEHRQAAVAYAEALAMAVEHGAPLRAADALDGLADLLPEGERATADGARAAADRLRRERRAVRPRRPWRRPSPPAAGPVPDGWIVDGRLTGAAARALELAIDTALAAKADDRPPTPATGALSRRELRVARLVAAGRSNREIGGELHISRRTVETHIAHAFQKLDVRSRSQLAVLVAAEDARGPLTAGAGDP